MLGVSLTSAIYKEMVWNGLVFSTECYLNPLSCPCATTITPVNICYALYPLLAPVNLSSTYELNQELMTMWKSEHTSDQNLQVRDRKSEQFAVNAKSL